MRLRFAQSWLWANRAGIESHCRLSPPDDESRLHRGGPEPAARAVERDTDSFGGLQDHETIGDLDVVKAAAGQPVLFDSGVRSGADIVKALALGATAVGIGRPYAYGLALGGAKGVAHVLRCLLAETDLIMAVDGYPSLADLTPGAPRPVNCR